MFHKDQLIVINTALGGVQAANYKGELRVIPGTHEVWVANDPARSRIIWTRQILTEGCAA